jgi:hypothetical protein
MRRRKPIAVIINNKIGSCNTSVRKGRVQNPAPKAKKVGGIALPQALVSSHNFTFMGELRHN